jgi:hypothetical protein
MTAQQIADQVDIPLDIAQIAVLNPIGKNIQVDVPDLAEVNQDGILIAGKDWGWVGPVLRTIKRLISYVKGGEKNLKNWIFKPSSKIRPNKQGKPIIGQGFSIKEQKFDYFFGRVTSTPKNQARSLQNLKDLKALGIDEKRLFWV